MGDEGEQQEEDCYHGDEDNMPRWDHMLKRARICKLRRDVDSDGLVRCESLLDELPAHNSYIYPLRGAYT